MQKNILGKKDTKRLYFFVLLSVSLLVLLLAYFYFGVRSYKIEVEKQIYYNYKGKLIEFRRPINLANRIIVLPDERSLNHSTYLLSLGIFRNITFVIFENDNNKVTALQILEIGTKILGLLEYELGLDTDIGLRVIKIKKDLNEIEISNKEYYVFLKSFLISNESYVRVHRYNLVEISGKNLEDFDLATIRFLLYFLENMKQLYK